MKSRLSIVSCPTSNSARLSSPILAGLVCLLIGTTVQAAQAETEDLPLPKWTEDEIRAFREPGGLTLPTEPLLPDVQAYLDEQNDILRSGPRLEDIPAELSGDITPRLRVEDLGSFLPDPSDRIEIRAAEIRASTTTSMPLKDVSREFLQAAADALRMEYLIDPDVLVPEMIHLQMMRFLDFHASDARIKLYVLVIDADKSIPADAKLDSLASGSLVKTDACLLVYPLKQPWRAKLFMSKAVIDQTSPHFLGETTRACLAEALNSSDPYDQLQSYGMELSTRLFWLQKAIGNQMPSVTEQTGAELASQLPTNSVSDAASAPRPQDPAMSDSPSLWWAAVTSCLTAAAGGAGVLFIKRRKRRRQSLVWILPEPEPKTRLGGAFAAGGAVMQW